MLIEGRLKLDSWEKDGQKRSKLRVVCEKMQMLGSREGGGGSRGGGGARAAAGSGRPQPQHDESYDDGYDAGPSAGASSSAAFPPDEIPF